MGSPGPADPYRLLGLEPGASEAEVRRAFRRLARRAHPDAGGDPARFLDLRRAHDLLTDPAARPGIDAPGAGVGSPAPPDAASPPPDAAPPPPGVGIDAGQAAALRQHWSHLGVAWRRPAVTVTGRVHDDLLVGLGTDGAGAAASQVGADVPVADAVVAMGMGDGSVRWRAELATPAVTPPLVMGPHVVAATADGVVHGLDAVDGITRWERRFTAPAVGVVVADTTVVVASAESVTALLPTGERSWAVRPHGGVSAVVSAESAAVVVHTGVGAVVALDPRTGATRWWLRSGAPWPCIPVVAGGCLWLPGGDPDGGSRHRVVGVDPRTGAALHSLAFPAAVVSLHAVGRQLVVRDAAQGITAVRSGRPQWRMVVPARPSAPTGLDGSVLVASADHVLHFLSAGSGLDLLQVPIAEVPGGPASLVVGPETVVVCGLAGGAVAHRVLRPAGGPSPR